MFVNEQTWSAQAILVADWSIPKTSSTLKLFGQMNRNVVGSIYGRPSIKIATNQHQELPVAAMFATN
jgi:hypothetical protein